MQVARLFAGSSTEVESSVARRVTCLVLGPHFLFSRPPFPGCLGGPLPGFWRVHGAHLSRFPFLFSESFRELCIASLRARRLAQCEVSSFHPGSVDPTKGTRVVLGRGARNFRAAHVCICDSPSGYRRVMQLCLRVYRQDNRALFCWLRLREGTKMQS